MPKKNSSRLIWRDGGHKSFWAEVQLNKAPGILAVVEGRDGISSVTALFEPTIATAASVADEAKVAVENWLIEIGARDFANDEPSD